MNDLPLGKSLLITLVFATVFSPVIIAHWRRHPQRWLITLLCVTVGGCITPLPFIVWALYPIPLTLEVNCHKYVIKDVTALYHLFCEQEPIYLALRSAYFGAAGENVSQRHLLQELAANDTAWVRARYQELIVAAKCARTHTLSEAQVVAVFRDAGQTAIRQMFPTP